MLITDLAIWSKSCFRWEDLGSKDQKGKIIFTSYPENRPWRSISLIKIQIQIQYCKVGCLALPKYKYKYNKWEKVLCVSHLENRPWFAISSKLWLSLGAAVCGREFKILVTDVIDVHVCVSVCVCVCLCVSVCVQLWFRRTYVCVLVCTTIHMYDVWACND